MTATIPHHCDSARIVAEVSLFRSAFLRRVRAAARAKAEKIPPKNRINGKRKAEEVEWGNGRLVAGAKL